MDRKRYLVDSIIRDLSDKMVFIGGARQVGKTTLARSLVGPAFRDTAYLNWDNRADRHKIMNMEYPGTAELIIL
ncbi:MAG: AAA family ATPase, partial [Clostridia bacterium]|nr:AAA family ATPase [Clostridia bacterium]